MKAGANVVTHNFIVCNICQTIIDLRTQIGLFDIHFNLHCPKCLTHINGKLLIDQTNPTVRLHVENAETLVGDVSFKNYYVAELSAEFPTKKLNHRTRLEFEETPFIRNAQLYNSMEESYKAISSQLRFSSFAKSDWLKLKSYFALYWNKKNELLYPELKKEINRYKFIPLVDVANDTDAIIALHQILLVGSGITSILEPNTLTEYIELSKKVFSDKSKHIELFRYFDHISPKINDIEKKFINIIDGFFKIFPQLIPVIALRNTGNLKKVDRDKFGIMSTNMDDLADFYAKSYEWILDNINIVIALNNIIVRNNYNDCGNGNYEQLESIASKFKKLDYLNELDPLSKPTKSLKNHIRNAIQHYDSDIDYLSQRICFSDKHRGKVNNVEMYLIDFASLCLENFSIVFYIIELIYSLRKIILVANGQIVSSANLLESKAPDNKPNVKIGRNSLCICGSGLKYKRCCGMT